MNNIQNQIDKILSDNFWPPNLETNKHYITIHDDIDAEVEKPDTIHVSIDRFGDCYLSTTGRVLRFRTFGGGGKYLRIRNALVLLAEAIRQEGELPKTPMHVTNTSTPTHGDKYSSAIVEIINILESKSSDETTLESIKNVISQFREFYIKNNG